MEITDISWQPPERLGKIGGLQARTAYERPIDLAFGKKFGCILSGHRTAAQHPDLRAAGSPNERKLGADDISTTDTARAGVMVSRHRSPRQARKQLLGRLPPGVSNG
jgi:hypothetical protein